MAADEEEFCRRKVVSQKPQWRLGIDGIAIHLHHMGETRRRRGDLLRREGREEREREKASSVDRHRVSLVAFSRSGSNAKPGMGYAM